MSLEDAGPGGCKDDDEDPGCGGMWVGVSGIVHCCTRVQMTSCVWVILVQRSRQRACVYMGGWGQTDKMIIENYG